MQALHIATPTTWLALAQAAVHTGRLTGKMGVKCLVTYI